MDVLLVLVAGIIGAASACVGALIVNIGAERRLIIRLKDESQQREIERVLGVQNEAFGHLDEMLLVVTASFPRLTMRGPGTPTPEVVKRVEEMITAIIKAQAVMMAVGDDGVSDEISNLLEFISPLLGKESPGETDDLIELSTVGIRDTLAAIEVHRRRLKLSAIAVES